MTNISKPTQDNQQVEWENLRHLVVAYLHGDAPKVYKLMTKFGEIAEQAYEAGRREAAEEILSELEWMFIQCVDSGFDQCEKQHKSQGEIVEITYKFPQKFLDKLGRKYLIP